MKHTRFIQASKMRVTVEVPVFKNGIEIGLRIKEDVMIRQNYGSIDLVLDHTDIYIQENYSSTLGKSAQKSRVGDKVRKMYDKIKLDSTTEILTKQNDHATKLHNGVQKEARILYQNEMQMSQADLRSAQRRAAKAAKKALKQSGH